MSRTKGSKNKPKDQTMPTPSTKTTSAEMKQFDQEASKGEVAIFSPPRLPFHPIMQNKFGIDNGTWKVLVEAIFPAAKTSDAIGLALQYCKSRNLDVMKRPVHIVPMWDSARGAMVETVWPGISELRTTASRTKGYAGCDVAEFGPKITMDFKGRIKVSGNWEDKIITGLEFPEWCRITVYRVVDGQRCKFVGPKVAWLEIYATQGASELPNKMWQERPEGQLEKCAEAAALRRAFPEEIGNELTAEEMTGRAVHDLAGEIPVITETADAASRDTAPPRSTGPEPAEEARDGTPPRRAPAEKKEDPISTGSQPKKEPKGRQPSPFQIPGTGESFETWRDKYIEHIQTSPDLATLYKWIDVNKEPLARQAKGRPSVYATIKDATTRLQEGFRDAQEKAATKAAAKAKPAAPPPAEMEEEPPAGDMDGPEPGANEFGTPASDNAEDILKWIDKTLAAVDAPEDLENIWTAECQKYTVDLMPPDQDEAQGIYRKHEKRLEP